MSTAFEVAETIPEGKLTRARGRAWLTIRVGDPLVFKGSLGEEIPVTVVGIESYGRSGSVLTSMWTGDLLLSSEGSTRPDGPGWILEPK